MTTPEHHEVRSKHVKAIWGKRCDILFFVRYTNTISFKRTIQGLFFINWMEIINVTWNKPCPIGCGSVGRAVTFDARGPRFESSHRQTFISDIYLFTVNCIEKTKIKKKRPGMAHLKKTPMYKKPLQHTPVAQFCYCSPYCISSMTRLGDFLHFGQLFKALGNN